jgi:cysteine sulfinate desulfinase/cysteine desulfurase-like protein
MGLEKEESENCVRFSFGKKSQKEDVEKLAEFILSLYK